MRKYFFILLLGLNCYSFQTKGQEAPIYNLFFMNPYVYNPAYAGSEQRMAAYINHRRQWLGVQDAPVTTTLSLHNLSYSRVTYGFNFVNDSRGIIQHNNMMGTIGYLVPFTDTHYFSFGLSAGFGYNNLNFSPDRPFDPNDPVLNNFNNKLYPDLQFGFRYFVNGLNVGIAFPKLINNRYTNSSPGRDIFFNPPLTRSMLMASYNFELTKKVLTFEPAVQYLMVENSPNLIETTGVFTINNLVKVGAAYRVNYGLAAILGLQTDKYSVGYAYEIASAQTTGIGMGTHEIQASFFIGEKKTIKRPNRNDGAREVPHMERRARFAVETEEERFNKSIQMEKGFYLVTLTTDDYEKAEKSLKSLTRRKIKAKVGYDKGVQKYHVYVDEKLPSYRKAEQTLRNLNKKSAVKATIVEVYH
jgi:type IX secretion system PorP/SprF family membrane protein